MALYVTLRFFLEIDVQLAGENPIFQFLLGIGLWSILGSFKAMMSLHPFIGYACFV
ncbi:hypothetical protein MHB42_08350 [Lysinibacillus sp. FSL K6-0232]|uniref:hypothetical protein n=1 Tax=Lysinibacillus sp. FSL K6-0232 TaxID=2921425 RepID=UPI0030F63084